MIAGPVARAQGAITAFQSSLGEIVCQVAEQQERADIAEARVRELEASRDRELRAEYRRGYSAGHKARPRAPEASSPPTLRAVSA